MGPFARGVNVCDPKDGLPDDPRHMVGIEEAEEGGIRDCPGSDVSLACSEIKKAQEDEVNGARKRGKENEE